MSPRADNIRALSESTLDVLVVGGGINGAVSAAALSTRGARVGLIDARDFAGFTSQHSSNLIWGGIKYMESFEFGLVTDLCKARNELMRHYPENIREIRFLTTVYRGFRHHPLVLWAGAWLYWMIGRGFTRVPRYLRPEKIHRVESAIDVENSIGGLEYSDSYLCDNDARFVFSFVRSALEQGCLAANYVEARAFTEEPAGWRVQAIDRESGEALTIRARTLVNATGAFVDTINSVAGIETDHYHVLSKGIHLLVPRIGNSDRVMAFFADDGRLFFAIPMANRTCIGTTDTRVDSPETRVTDADREFVLSNINDRLCLARPLTRQDVISERCGVRPLVMRKGTDSGSDFLQLSRKHVLETCAPRRYISIFGGKLTDCINIGEEVCQALTGMGITLNKPREKWYGEPGESARSSFFDRARALGLADMAAEDTGEALARRLWRRYGNAAAGMLELIAEDRDMARSAIAGTGFRRCEIEFLREHEMIVHLGDLLRRRSRLALLYRPEDLRNLPGLRETCQALFGERAEEELDAYFSTDIPTV